MSSCPHIQTAIIGAGVIGLSVARALSKRGHELIILEQSNAIRSGISSRNSEVIHAGIYYDKDATPFKSRFCVEGKTILYVLLIINDLLLPEIQTANVFTKIECFLKYSIIEKNINETKTCLLRNLKRLMTEVDPRYMK